MDVYLRAKFEVSSVILTGFRRGGEGVILPSPPPQNEPLKSPPRLGLRESLVIKNICFLQATCRHAF